MGASFQPHARRGCALWIAASLAIVAISAAVLGYSLARQEDVEIARNDHSDGKIATQHETPSAPNDQMKHQAMNQQQSVKPDDVIDGSVPTDGGSTLETFGADLNTDGVSPADGRQAPTAFGGVSPRVDVAKPRGLGGQPRGGTGRFAGASPSRWLSVAADATVLVSTGGGDPIELGVRAAVER